jgi:hypothetical protein
VSDLEIGDLLAFERLFRPKVSDRFLITGTPMLELLDLLCQGGPSPHERFSQEG